MLHKLGVDTKRHNSFIELIFDQKKILKNASHKAYQSKKTIIKKYMLRISNLSEHIIHTDHFDFHSNLEIMPLTI